MKDYVDARREFWEGCVYACLSNPNEDLDTGPTLEQCLKLWDKRYMQGPNGTVVPRDEKQGTYNASEAGAT